MKLIYLGAAMATWLIGATPRAAALQAGADARCAEAVRLVAMGQATDIRAAGVATCSEGPAAIAGRWRAADDNPETLAQLHGWNYQIRDQRIAEAVTATARDASRPTSVRLLALKVLVSYFDPCASIESWDLANPPPFPSLGSFSHCEVRVGAKPPGKGTSYAVYALSRELTRDPNPVVARAAKAVWQALTDARPNAAWLPAGTLNLVNVCGSKFRITNSSDIDLSAEIETAPGPPGRTRMQVRIPAQVSRETHLDVPDTARLFFGDQEVASAASGSTQCP